MWFSPEQKRPGSNVLHCHADALQDIDVVRQTLDNTEGAIKMDNPEKLTTLGTQNEDKQNRKRNTICVEHDYAKTNIYNVNKA